MIFFTSDWHLGHKNIIDLCGRPFKDIEEMKNKIVENYLAVVKSNDTVYHLGDVAFVKNAKERQELKYLMSSLPGDLTLIRGNHDRHNKIDRLLESGFPQYNFVQDYLEIKYKGIRFVMSHYPAVSWYGQRTGSIMLHGHVHNREENRCGFCEDNEREKYRNIFNVGVDLNNFAPVSIEDIIESFKNCMPKKEV